MHSIKSPYNSNDIASFHKSKTCIEMHRILRLVVSISIIFIFSNVAGATDYYVATTGDNSDNGLSIENAWATPSYAVGNAIAGDTVYLIGGTWEGEVIDFDGKQGNATHPITLTKYNGTVILNNSYIEASATDTLDMYINISDITISNSIGNGIYFRYSDNIHIKNVEVFNTGAGGKAIYFLDAWNSSLIDSNLHDTGWNTVMVQSNYNDVYNILIDNNTIYNSSHAGSQHNTLDFYNYNTGGSMHDVIVRNNHIYNAAEQLLFFHNDGKGVLFDNFYIHNNIFHDSGVSGYVGVNYLTNSIFENNIIYNSGLRNDGGTAQINMSYRNNTIYNPISQQYTIQLSGTPTKTHYSINDNSSSFRSLTGNLIIADAFRTSYNVRGSGVGLTVKYTDNNVFSENGIGAPIYYPTHSNWTTNDDATRTITTYSMTARPTTYPATITVNKFDTTLTQGNILVDFTANTTDGNNVAFTVNELQPNYYYLIKKDGTNFTTTQANSTGYIQFSNSEWSEHTFTIEETSQPEVELDTPVSITPSTTQISPDETFTLTIPITPATPITGAQFDLIFDNSLATVTTVTEGNLLNQDGATTLFNSGTINNAAGTVTNVYGSILGESSVSSQGSFTTISMTAGGTTGYLNLDLTNVKISDADSNAAPYTLTNATILIDTAPVLDSIGAKSVDEGSALTFTTGASDVDGDSLTYAATNLPTGASFNTATGTFSWTPADGQAGIYVITFEVTDSYLSDSETITITANDANNAPVITTFVPANSLTYNESNVITIGIIATDADGQALSYTIKIDGVTKSTSSSYVWETDYSSAGSHTIDIIVSDGIEQVTDSRTITINDVHPRWDVNEDGTVNVLDISIIGQKYGASVEAPYPRWDVNQDGAINVQDMTLAGSHFGETVV